MLQFTGRTRQYLSSVGQSKASRPRRDYGSPLIPTSAVHGWVLQGNDPAFDKARHEDMSPCVGPVFGVDKVIVEVIPLPTMIGGRQAIARFCQSTHDDRDRKAACASRLQYAHAFRQAMHRVRHMFEGVGMNHKVVAAAWQVHGHHVEFWIIPDFMPRQGGEEPTQITGRIDLKDPKKSTSNRTGEAPKCALDPKHAQDGQCQCLGSEIRTAIGALCTLLPIYISDLLGGKPPAFTEFWPDNRTEGLLSSAAARTPAHLNR